MDMPCSKEQNSARGLKYRLATGNWGAQGTHGVRAGVSQVCLVVATSPLWGEAHVDQNLPKLVADPCLHPEHHTASAHLVVVGQYDSCACARTMRLPLHPIYVVDLRQASIMSQHVVLFCPIGQVCCVCCMHGKLCCTNHGVPHPDPLIFLCAGAEQAGVCQHAVSLAAHQQPHR